MTRGASGREIRVPGFRFGAAACGIKASGAPDVGVILADAPASAAAVFTRNRFRAAPVVLGAERVRGGRLQAVVVNSGNANACTGEGGLRDARRGARVAARALGVDERLVVPASTGVIGVRLPMSALEAGIETAVGSATPDGLGRFARAIMTSDAFEKVASRSLRIAGQPVTIAGIAKGAGMIAPDMATLLVFLLSDAAVRPRELRGLVRSVARSSFNELSIDGDTSTNDSLFVLAGGAARNAAPEAGSRDLAALERAACEIGCELARLVASDGEGATKLVTIEVAGARDDAQARRLARAVSDSPLVKTAFFGADPNWGRIAMALGKAGVLFDPSRVTIRIGGVAMFRRGAVVDGARPAARAAMRKREIAVAIDVGAGPGRARVLGTDLSHDYVQFNSAYTT